MYGICMVKSKLYSVLVYQHNTCSTNSPNINNKIKIGDGWML